VVQEYVFPLAFKIPTKRVCLLNRVNPYWTTTASWKVSWTEAR